MTMSKNLTDIVQAAGVVKRILHKMAGDGKIEAAAVEVENLAWSLDMKGAEGWYLSLRNVEPKTEEKLVTGLIGELEKVGLGWDDWDVYTEHSHEDGTSIPQS
jgi:hypothetical protein